MLKFSFLGFSERVPGRVPGRFISHYFYNTSNLRKNFSKKGLRQMQLIFAKRDFEFEAYWLIPDSLGRFYAG